MKPQSIAHLFFDACDRYNKPDAVRCKHGGAYQPFSHRFFSQRVSMFARGLMGLGVQPGDHIAILAETRFEWAIADLATIAAGAVNMPVYPTLPSQTLSWILNNADAKGIIVSTRELLNKVLAIRAELADLQLVIVMDEPGESIEGVLPMRDVEIMGSATDNETAFIDRWQALKEDDLLTIIYTSGTTGMPKGVMLSHGNVLANIKSCESFMDFGPEDCHLSHLPLCHVLERTAGFYVMLYRGVTIAYAEEIRTVADNLLEVKPTVLVSVPRLYEKIHARIMHAGVHSGFIKKSVFSWAMGVGRKAVPYFNRNKPLPGFLKKKWQLAEKLVFSKIKERTGGRLHFMVSGGAPLSKEIAEFFLGMGMKLLEGYGLTETSPVLTFNRPDKNKPGTVGPPIPGVEIELGEDNEILARGPNVMLGYYNNPEATAAVLVDGWLHTGDVGVLDGDNFLRITDRKKDLIITSGGKNIAPQPLEKALMLSPFIEQAVVIGEQRNFISALLCPPYETIEEWAPANGWPTDPLVLTESPDFLQTMEYEVNKQMHGFAHYERIRKFKILPRLLSVDAGELTPSMKVKRDVVNRNYASLIDDLYE